MSGGLAGDQTLWDGNPPENWCCSEVEYSHNVRTGDSTCENHRFSDHRILSILKQAEAGRSVPDMCGEDKQIPILSDIGKIRGQSSKNPTPIRQDFRLRLAGSGARLAACGREVRAILFAFGITRGHEFTDGEISQESPCCVRT